MSTLLLPSLPTGHMQRNNWQQSERVQQLYSSSLSQTKAWQQTANDKRRSSYGQISNLCNDCSTNKEAVGLSNVRASNQPLLKRTVSKSKSLGKDLRSDFVRCKEPNIDNGVQHSISDKDGKSSDDQNHQNNNTADYSNAINRSVSYVANNNVTKLEIPCGKTSQQLRSFKSESNLYKLSSDKTKATLNSRHNSNGIKVPAMRKEQLQPVNKNKYDLFPNRTISNNNSRPPVKNKHADIKLRIAEGQQRAKFKIESDSDNELNSDEDDVSLDDNKFQMIVDWLERLADGADEPPSPEIVQQESVQTDTAIHIVHIDNDL